MRASPGPPKVRGYYFSAAERSPGTGHLQSVKLGLQSRSSAIRSHYGVDLEA
jgi:hypothetical protein